MEKRIYKIDTTKGILIFLVVTGHMLLPLQGRTRLLTNLFYAIYCFHMPAFVFLSGILAFGFVNSEGAVRWKRWLRLVYWYVIFEVIVFFSEIPAYGKSGDFPDLFHESGSPWYLLCLIEWYLMIPLLRNLKRRLRGPAGGEARAEALLGGAILLISLASGYLRGVGDFLSLDRGFAFAPFFYLGYFLAEHRLIRVGLGMQKEQCRLARLLRAVGAVTLICVFLFLFDRGEAIRNVFFGTWYDRLWEGPGQQNHWHMLWALRLFWYLLASAVSYLFFCGIPQGRAALPERVGRQTLPIYILHRPIRDMLLAAGFFDSINPGSKQSLALLLLCSFALTWLLSCSPVSGLFAVLDAPFRHQKKERPSR